MEHFGALLNLNVSNVIVLDCFHFNMSACVGGSVMPQIEDWQLNQANNNWKGQWIPIDMGANQANIGRWPHRMSTTIEGLVFCREVNVSSFPTTDLT
ncbi:hypothetical protein BLOT_000132 [Blomia tropicalis]|nr:hypothetical protein BLOT_000132 [Blomia tropicalis]